MISAPVQAVLDRLHGVKPAGPGKWTALCPVHEADGNGHKPSLSIGQGDDGRALLSCMAGCATRDVVQALGLTLAALFPSKARATHKPAPRPAATVHRFGLPCLAAKAIARQVGGTLTGWWPYFNVDAGESLTVLRFDLPDVDPKTGKPEKTFRPIHPDGDGWAIGDPVGPLPLYRLAEIRGAARVHVFEGERCADEAARLGLSATTSAHGAKSASKSDWRPLAGHDVPIWRDNDRAGEGYARDVATILTALTPPARVRIMRLSGLPEGGDIVDYLGPDGPVDAHSPEEIKAMIETQADAAFARPPDETEHAVVRRAADIKTCPLSWLWQDKIPANKLSLGIGHPGKCKTLLALDISARLSVGRGFSDGASCEVGNTLFCSGEDDAEDTLVPRLRAAGADLNRISFLDGVRWRDPETKEIRIAAVELDRHIDAIREAVIRTQAKLFIVDPISSFVGQVDDHRNSELRALLSALASVARDTRCAIFCISHLRKSGGLAVHQAVGSLAYTAAARAVWAVLGDPQDADRRLLLPVKMNLCRDSSGLAFRAVSDPAGSGHPILSWEPDPITAQADDILNPPTTRPGPLPIQRDEAAEWLTCALRSGPRDAKGLIEEADSIGITPGTLRRAKEVLGVMLARDGFQGPWMWRLPSSSAKGAQ